jgi:hypothetical protein
VGVTLEIISCRGCPLRGNHITTAGWQPTERAGLLVPAERQYSQSEGARIPEQQAPRWGAGPGAACFSSNFNVALRVSSGSRPVAAIELGQFGSLSLVVRVEPSSPASAEPPTAKLLVPSGSIGVRTGYPVE